MFDPPGTAARARPVVWVRQPVPAHAAVASARSPATVAPVTVSQAPRVAQVAVDAARVRPVPVAAAEERLRVAQPAAVPSSQVADVQAVIAVPPPLEPRLGRSWVTVVPAPTAATQAVLPEQPVAAEPVEVARRPWSFATALELPRTVPVHPASGHTIWELVAPVAAARTVLPSPRSVAADASLVAAQPEAAARQVAFVVDRPGRPDVAPVVAARQAGPAHSAAAVDRASVAGASFTGFAASFAAAFAALRASVAVFAVAFAFAMSLAVAPGRAATCFAASAAARALVACWASCSALSLFCSATMSATTWPDAATELVCTRHALCAVVQVPLVVPPPVGGPRAPFALPPLRGPSMPIALERAVPEHAVAAPAQSRVASAIDQDDAPATVGPPVLALDPGAVGAGGTAGWFCPGVPCWSCGWSPVCSEVTVAFSVGAACMIGAIRFASGPVEAPELVTAWQIPPVTPSQDAVPDEPRASFDTDGSVARAAEVTDPVQAAAPWHSSTPPEADAADAPFARRAALVAWSGPASASAAPGPVAAVETDCTWQPPVPAAQLAVPVEVRGVVVLAVPSNAVVVVVTVPEHFAPAAQFREASDRDTDDGPASA